MPASASRLATLSAVTIALVFAIAFGLRESFLWTVSDMLGCDGCLVWASLRHEAALLLGALGLHALGNSLRPGLGRSVLRALIVAALVVVVIDLGVLQFFMVRLNRYEWAKFMGETDAIRAFVGTALGSPLAQATAGLGALAGLAATLAYLALPVPAQARPRLAVWGLGLLGLAVLLAGTAPRNVHTLFVENAVQALLRPQTRLVPYSHPPVGAVPDAAVPLRCAAGLGDRRPLVLVVVESLSTYQSRALGGIHDWTPHLDHWIQKGAWIESFHANGLTTEDGLVAMLTGMPPVPKPQATTLLQQYARSPRSLPGLMSAHGLQTAFLTTGNLAFMGKGAWLRGLGFDYLEGHDHPDYRGLPRLHFDAAPDGALYQRALRWMGEATEPYLLVLETVSSHQPYRHPVTGERSLESVIRYADEALDGFLKQLAASGFLQRGHVLVVGDHRAMVPASSEELERFGDRAYTRVPLVILGPGVVPGPVAGAFSQTDLLPTLLHRVSAGASCTPAGQGVFWPSDPHPADCLLTRRPYDLDRVVVQCGAADHPVTLAAHATRYLDDPPGPAGWIEQIHRFRMGQSRPYGIAWTDAP